MYDVPAEDTDAAVLFNTVECLLKQLRQEQPGRAQEFLEGRSALTSLSAEALDFPLTWHVFPLPAIGWRVRHKLTRIPWLAARRLGIPQRSR